MIEIQTIEGGQKDVLTRSAKKNNNWGQSLPQTDRQIDSKNSLTP